MAPKKRGSYVEVLIEIDPPQIEPSSTPTTSEPTFDVHSPKSNPHIVKPVRGKLMATKKNKIGQK